MLNKEDILALAWEHSEGSGKRYTFTEESLFEFLNELKKDQAPAQDELLPCPFCGGEPNLTNGDYVRDDLSPMPVVECKSCSAWVRVEDWNRRPAQTEQQPVAWQHKKPTVNDSGEVVGYSTWTNGKGLDWWPRRPLYTAQKTNKI